MYRTYSYQELVDGVMKENQFVKKNKIKHMCIGIVYAIVPAIIVGMVLLSLVLGDIDDGRYKIEFRPYQELTSPYRPYPTYLGQDLPQVWEIKIRNGKQFGIPKFLNFKPQGVPDSLRITLAEYKQVLIDNNAYITYAWGGNQQRSD